MNEFGQLLMASILTKVDTDVVVWKMPGMMNCTVLAVLAVLAVLDKTKARDYDQMLWMPEGHIDSTVYYTISKSLSIASVLSTECPGHYGSWSPSKE